MKRLLVLLIITFSSVQLFAGDTARLYNSKADAAKDIKAAISKAKKEGKHVLIQAGGNWCSWCIKFNKFTHEQKRLDSLIKENYVVYHLNWSKENENKALFAKYGYPQRFGFPVFIILDEKGNRLHTQNSVYLEEGKGYSEEKTFDFLWGWTPKAVSPNSYK
jgi:thioredoxin-related protein